MTPGGRSKPVAFRPRSRKSNNSPQFWQSRSRDGYRRRNGWPRRKYIPHMEVPMPKPLIRRAISAAAAVFGLCVVMAGFAGPASAHEVSDITANCNTVRVSFTGFPQSGVTVHIAATVQGHGAVSTDVFVNDKTTAGSLDISSVTDDMFGATAKVDVDVTWTFDGPQHV